MQLKMDEVIAERIIPANDSVRLLDQTVEEMDMRPLWSTYKRLGRKPATNPVTLFKILVYAYMEGVYSSRDIESACKRDINFIWLLNGARTPNHHEIARFRSRRLPACAESMFYVLVKLLGNKGEICYEHLFVDGTKIEANANKYSFVWKKSTTKYEARLLEKLEVLCQELSQRHGVLEQDAEGLLLALESKITAPFVYGRGKRKTQLQRDIEQMRDLLKRREKYADYQQSFKGRNSFSKTDRDATFMHMKEDHMRNAQLKPGYNIQLGVEGEYITGVLVSSERNDVHTMIPLFENMEEQLGRQYQDATLDAGFESEENYTYFEGKRTACYIKPQNYERSKTKKFKSNMALRENMAYNAGLDEYTCQQGRKLRAQHEGIRKSKSGFESIVTYYECEDCSSCPSKKQCTRSKGNRKLQVSKRFIAQRAESLKRITSEQGVLLRMNRSIQAEGAFGVLKQNYAFRRFMLRGHRKVSVEIFLLAMAYNVNKYHAKIQQNRTGSQLFEKLTA